jgi:uncharacterized protein YqeY
VADDEASLRVRLRDALQVAIKERDHAATAALRSALGAVDNAEAVQIDGPADYGDGGMGEAGLGMAEVARGVLSDDEVASIVRSEVEERVAEAEEYERCGEHERADVLRAGAATLARHLAD